MSNNLKKVQERTILTMADQQKVVYGLSNGTVFNDLSTTNTVIKVTPFFDAEYLTYA